MEFSRLADSARVWVYQADRPLTDKEITQIESLGKTFVNNWSAHGSDLAASIGVQHKFFVVVAVDESVANATGCSIDKSVHFMQDLGKSLDVDFFNRLNLVVQKEQGLELIPISKIEALAAAGKVRSTDLCFDNTIQTKEELENSWCVPIGDTWAARYF